jgi:hypothetical protein
MDLFPFFGESLKQTKKAPDNPGAFFVCYRETKGHYFFLR